MEPDTGGRGRRGGWVWLDSLLLPIASVPAAQVRVQSLQGTWCSGERGKERSRKHSRANTKEEEEDKELESDG